MICPSPLLVVIWNTQRAIISKGTSHRNLGIDPVKILAKMRGRELKTRVIPNKTIGSPRMKRLIEIGNDPEVIKIVACITKKPVTQMDIKKIVTSFLL